MQPSSETTITHTLGAETFHLIKQYLFSQGATTFATGLLNSIYKSIAYDSIKSILVPTDQALDRLAGLLNKPITELLTSPAGIDILSNHLSLKVYQPFQQKIWQAQNGIVYDPRGYANKPLTIKSCIRINGIIVVIIDNALFTPVQLANFQSQNLTI